MASKPGRLARVLGEDRASGVVEATVPVEAELRLRPALVSSGSKDGADFDHARQAQRALVRKGLNARFVMEVGEPKRALLAMARKEGVDCIFVGARGRSGIVRMLLGSVSSALAARAHCSVEIVRATT